MADGLCQKYVSCCYTYRGVFTSGDPEEDICACTSDPSASGFDSCEALAASMKQGKVVDLCPKYKVSPL
jgi:hypothetical protein